MMKALLLKLRFVRIMNIFLKNTKLYFRIKRKQKKHGKCIFLMATPVHGNLGDQAIVCAEYKFLNDIGYSDEIVEISNSEYILSKRILKKCIRKDDIVVIDGGGNMGILWPDEDDKLSEIIDTYTDNKIIIFPQTCYYDAADASRERLAKNQRIYAKHPDLTISLRDRQSYNFVCENFKTVNSIFMPDIVLYLDKVAEKCDREGCLLCFREDLEKDISDDDINKLKKYLDKAEIEYNKTSTVIDRGVNSESRINELDLKWKEFASAEFVVTDRLHAMIFAAITDTCCVALDNRSKKVSGVGEWLDESDYIKICNDVNEIISLIETDNLKNENDGYRVDKSAFDELKRSFFNEQGHR